MNFLNFNILELKGLLSIGFVFIVMVGYLILYIQIPTIYYAILHDGNDDRWSALRNTRNSHMWW